MRIRSSVAILVVAAAVLAGAASGLSAAQARAPGTEASACSLPISRDRAACRVSYLVCASFAKTKVRAYYLGHGASLDIVATRYAKSQYNAETWQAGLAGCLAALMDEYHRLYGG